MHVNDQAVPAPFGNILSKFTGDHGCQSVICSKLFGYPVDKPVY